MIVSLHVATGAAGGALAGSRRGALLLGPVLHLLGDLTPHKDIPSTAFEVVSGSSALLLLAWRRGPLDPATVGGLAAAIPDVEHVLHQRMRRRKLFPTHRFAGWHRRGGLSPWVQLTAAGVTLGLLAAPRRGGL